MVLSNIPYLIQGDGNIELTSNNGVINHNSETAFLHANDSFISDIKGLKGSATSGDLIGYNGTNIYSLPSSNFAQSSDLSSYLLSSDQVVQSVTTSDQLVLTGGALSLNLSAYLTSDQIASNYTSATAGTNFDTRISSLENDHVTSDQFSTLSTTVSGIESAGYIAGSDQYIQSVGSNLSVAGSQLNVDLSGCAQSSDLSNYVQTSAQYIQSVGTNLSVSGNELNVDLSGCLQSGDQYIQSVGTNLSVSGNQLNVDLSGCVTSGDLSGYLQSGDQYIQSVGSNLSVSGNELNVDLSSCVPHNDASFTGLTTVESLAYAMGSGVPIFKEKCYFLPMTELTQTGSFENFFCGFNRQQHFDIKAYLSGAVNGKLDLTKCFRGGGNSAMAIVSSASNLGFVGTVTGNEVDVIHLSDNNGCAQQLTYNIPAYTSMVVKLTFCEQNSN
jgi:hypothetical protein